MNEEEHLSLIRRELEASDIPFSEINMYAKTIKGNEKMGTWHFVSETDYHRLGDLSGRSYEKLTLNENEALVAYYENALGQNPNSANGIINELKNIEVLESKENNLVLEIKKSFGTNLFPLHEQYVIVADEIFNELTQFDNQSNYTFFYVKDWKETVESSRVIAEVIPNWGDSHIYFSLPYMWSSVNTVYGATLFVGLFIGAVFFVAAGSFLYFRLYTDLEDEKRKFSMISKLGLTNKELSKLVSIQLAILFFVPIIVAVIHGTVALTALQHMFAYSLVKESVLVLGSFSVIQVIYFLFIRSSYLRKLKQAI